jgi:hypothetical protein
VIRPEPSGACAFIAEERYAVRRKFPMEGTYLSNIQPLEISAERQVDIEPTTIAPRPYISGLMFAALMIGPHFSISAV